MKAEKTKLNAEFCFLCIFSAPLILIFLSVSELNFYHLRRLVLKLIFFFFFVDFKFIKVDSLHSLDKF